MRVPRFVVFEGPDGVGKTTFINAVAEWYTKIGIGKNLMLEWFPGKDEGTLGAWVYKMHHTWKVGVDIDPIALQTMHVAAHIDNLKRKLMPWFRKGGYVILDRFWWSTYAYGRMTMTKKQTWTLVQVERQFWKGVPDPVFIYLTRSKSLKPDEADPKRFKRLNEFYSEVLREQKREGFPVHVINNEGTPDRTIRSIFSVIGL